MKSQTRCVVIGGGIAGCSTLYHLTQEGWSDVVLVERDELTSGTTWHSAAQVTNFGMNQTMVGLKTHSINLYKELAEDPDYPINYHHGDGGIRLTAPLSPALAFTSATTLKPKMVIPTAAMTKTTR